jgi:predicted nucleotidyltransferase
MSVINNFTEGSKFKRLNFPDPFKYGDIYKPIFPPRHHTMKAIMDNIPSAVSKIYVFGSSLRLDTAVNSDLDVFFVGSMTNDEYCRIIRAIPKGEKADIMTETEQEFINNIKDESFLFYKRVYEEGYKIYEREA